MTPIEHRAYNKEARAKSRARHPDQTREYALQAKYAAFDHYGWFCQCCGEEDIRFFCLDHINNDGAFHRKQNKSNLYTWARVNNYPPTLQTYCHNCNFAKHVYGVCPHGERKLTKKDVREE